MLSVPEAAEKVGLQRRYTLAWIGWFLYFFVVETFAIRNPRTGDTLSEHGWSWGAIKERTRYWRWRRIGLGALLLWLAIHIMTGGWV